MNSYDMQSYKGLLWKNLEKITEANEVALMKDLVYCIVYSPERINLKTVSDMLQKFECRYS